MEKQVKGYTCKVLQDQNPESPDSWDNIPKLMTFHRGCYIQEDKAFKRKEEEFKAFLRDNEKTLFIMPVRAYIHSGVALSFSGSTYPFNDPWDACQVGVMFCTKKEARDNWGKGWTKKIQKAFEAHLETWNQYLRGEVYGYTVEDKDGNHVDSCWGFYGPPEDCMKEAEAAAKAQHAHELKTHGEQLCFVPA